MNETTEIIICTLLLISYIWYSVQMLSRRLRVERELVILVSINMSFEKLNRMTDEELKTFALHKATTMNISDRTIAIYPFIQDSIYGQAAYTKRFRTLVEYNFRG